MMRSSVGSARGKSALLWSLLREDCPFYMCETLCGRKPWPEGTDRSNMPRYLAQSDFAPFPFQSGRIMARFQLVGMTQYFQMNVKRGCSQH